MYLFRGVSSFHGPSTDMVFGDSNSVLFIKVSLFRGVLLRGAQLYVMAVRLGVCITHIHRVGSSPESAMIIT